MKKIYLLLLLLTTYLGAEAFNVTFSVDMTNVSGYSVANLNGTMNGWCGGCATMSDVNGDNIWEITLDLAAGTYEYKFTADGGSQQENLTPGSICTLTSGAYTNRIITVTADTTVPTVCWGSCTACSTAPGCTDMNAVNYDPAAGTNNGSCLYATNFNVEMNCTVPFTNVYITGPWCGWCAAETYNLLTDANADGIFNVTLNLPAGNVEYKYMVDNWASQENLVDDVQNGGTCAPVTDGVNYANRQIVVGTTTNDVYGRCTACQVGIPGCMDVAAVNYNSIATYTDGSCLYATEFNVDMNCAETAFSNVYVTGPWCGWCGAEAYNIMTDGNADGIYTVTVNLAAGNVEYKYMVDNFASQENLVDDMQNGASCAPVTDYANYANRQSPTGQVKNDVYGRCSACPVLGCTNAAASNYNASATVDNGTCLYATNFNVDMTCAGTAFINVYITGPWCGWCGAEAYNVMTDANADGIYNVTLNLAAGNIEYKYMVDNWASQENLVDDMQNGASCAPITDYANYANRQIVIGTTTNDVYGRCTACQVGIPGCMDVAAVNYNSIATYTDGSCLYATEFNVDMNCAETAFSNVYVTGPWCGWCAAESYNLLTDANADGIYSVTVNLAAGNVEYKYMVDNWASQENLVDDVQNGGTCAPVTDGVNFANRQIVVGTTTNDTYGKCTSCGGVTPDPCDILTVAFDDAGSLSSWTALADATLPEASMTWDATGALRISGSNTSTAIGKAYIFQYLNNTVNYNGNTTVQLEFDVKSVGALVGTALHLQTEFPGTGVTNTFDIQNAGLNENTWTHYTYTFNNVAAASNFRMHFNMAAGAFLGAGGTLLVDNIELNCYTPVIIAGCTDPTALNYNAAATEDDGSCTYPQTYNVTFQVDMTQYAGTFTTPEVNGTFNGWCGNCNAMSDANGDNIWEVTLPLLGGTYEYKFAHDAWTGQENLTPGSACTVTNSGFTNRLLNLTADVVLPAVCWASCSSCGIAPVSHSVTFQVDMQNVTGFTTPEINGTFNNWCGGCFVMTDANGDNIWEGTTVLEEGTYEFKYAYDSWAGSEQLTAGDACTITNGGFTNRLLSVTADVVLPVVCWASCVDCGGTATPVDVTFQVDMSQYLGSFTTPEVNGTFNNWCGGCAPMSDANGDNKWELTIPLIPGTYEYKFAFDSWLGQENLIAGSTCTVTNNGFTNRVITAIDAETLPAVCWESCELCPDFVNESSNTISVYPNPSNGNIRINSNLALPYNIEVFDLSGRKVQDMKVFQSNTEINLENLAKGAYQIRVSNNYNSVRETVIIK